MCTTIGILPQHKERYRLMKRIEEYDELLVATSDGEEITIENNIDSVASAICKYGLMGDITVNTEDYIVRYPYQQRQRRHILRSLGKALLTVRVQ